MTTPVKQDCFSVTLHFFREDQAKGDMCLPRESQRECLTLHVGGEEGDAEFTVRDAIGSFLCCIRKYVFQEPLVCIVVQCSGEVYLTVLGGKNRFSQCAQWTHSLTIPLAQTSYEVGGESGLVEGYTGDGVCVFKFSIDKETECCRVGRQSFLLTLGCVSVLLCFTTRTEFNIFHKMLTKQSSLDKEQSSFDQRTDLSSARQYFQFYGCLSQQQNMLQDYLRTATYQKAILLNEVDFRDKVVLDVGCGSGILSFFAVQAGARKVYAVEASSVAKYAQMLVKNNHLSERIIVMAGKIEEVSFPEMVDVIVSEPIGYMLLNERMLESYLHSKKWLKPRGMMFPTFSDLHLAPFTDEQLYMEHYARSGFWHQTSFFGIDLSSLHSAAVDEFFKQPIVDTFDKQILMAKSVKFSINFLEAKEEDLHRMEIPFVFQLHQSGLIHGLAVWFDVAFVGTRSTVWLSTSPSEPLTHWYQVRCLLQTPLFAKAGQTLSGTVLLVANKRQSYDIHLSAVVDQSGFKSGNTLDLKNPFFRYA